MPVQYTIEFVEEHLELHITGVPDRESITQMWCDVSAACTEHECQFVLAFAEQERALDLQDALEYAEILEEAGITNDHRIAWIQRNAAAMVMTRMVEEMLHNKNLLMARAFSDESEGRHWLAEERMSNHAR